MDDPISPLQVTPPSPETNRLHRQEIARYKSELAAYTLRQWNIARLDAEKKESDRRQRRMHALAQYAAAGMTSPSSAAVHSRPPPPPDGTAQYHHSAGGHILMTTRRENRRSFTTSATNTPPYQHVYGHQPHHHAQQQHQPHSAAYSQYAQHIQRLESAPSSSEYQRSCAVNTHPLNTHAAAMPAQMNHARSSAHVTYVESDSNVVCLSQSMSTMAIDSSSRHHARAYDHAAYPSSSGHWHPPQPIPPPPHPHRHSTSTSAARAAGRHLGTQLLSMTPVHHSHGKSSSAVLTSDEDSPMEEVSTEGSSRTSSSSLSRKPRSPQAQDGVIPPPDVLGYRPNAAHHPRASMPVPQRKAKEMRDAHMDGLQRSATANPGGEGYGTADHVRRGGGSPGGSLTVRTPGVRI